MKTIKVFLASSEELEDDRNAFGNLVRKLNKTYEKRGIHLELFEWEDYDAAFNDRRKQDEYNDEVRASDMFLAVFHTKAGKFTIEEFDVATEEFRKKGLPKSYVYCKDLKEGELESQELQDFKKRLFNEMGHYWSRYGNRDTMQLHFVMQLQLVECSRNDELKVENGNLVLDGQLIAHMKNLPFAGLNEDFQKMSARLMELPEKIEKARTKTEKYPDDEDFKDELQALLNEYNKLKDDFTDYQNNLFATAKRIAQLQGENISERMRRAMDAFNEGKVHEANIILDEAERDGERALNEYKQSKEITEQKRHNVIKSIEEILLKTNTTMADISIDIEERIAKVEALYSQAYTMATEVDYDEEKYTELLSKYADFLSYYAKYDNAIEIYTRNLALCEKLYGVEHASTATLYNNIGLVYNELGDYDKALEYYLKSLAIDEKILGAEHPDTATLYNNIGGVYKDLGDYDKALEYYLKSLAIDEKVLGAEHPDTATLYNNIGLVYNDLGDYDKALEYYLKSLAIVEKVLGAEHPDTATSYNSIGLVYDNLGDYDKALEYFFKALAIYEKVLGIEHPATASSYNNIGGVYKDLGDYDKSLEYNSKALAIDEKVLGVEHPYTATSYNNIGLVYNDLGDYDKALEYSFKALAIYEKVLGAEHPSTITLYSNIAYLYEQLGESDKATEYRAKAQA